MDALFRGSYHVALYTAGFPPEAPRCRVTFFRGPDGNLLELFEPAGPRYLGGEDG